MNYQYKNLQVEKVSNGIAQVSLHRPDKLNALSFELLNELHDFVKTAAKDSSIKAILFTGSGKAFSAGADISNMGKFDIKTGYDFSMHGQEVFRALEQSSKPIVAAINGYAFGGGFELALACHLRIASSNAQFGQPEVRLGVIPGYGGTQRLSRIVGKGRTIDLCITGKTINAEEALQWGLISEVTSPEELIPRGIALLENILTKAPYAVAKVLQVIDAGLEMDLENALLLEANYFAMCCATKDKNEGVNAFLEKETLFFQENEIKVAFNLGHDATSNFSQWIQVLTS